jgi:putative addiction module component (TIGR02574 family)
MAITREQLEAEARRLPKEERARLAEALIASLDEEAEVEQAWVEEIRRRVAELRSGDVVPIPADEVFAELDDLTRA